MHGVFSAENWLLVQLYMTCKAAQKGLWKGLEKHSTWRGYIGCESTTQPVFCESIKLEKLSRLHVRSKYQRLSLACETICPRNERVRLICLSLESAGRPWKMAGCCLHVKALVGCNNPGTNKKALLNLRFEKQMRI